MGTYGGNQPQQGDVLLYQSAAGGEINESGGVTEMTGGFDTMAYLILYGGNADDKGGADLSKQWWANFIEEDPAQHERGEFQYLIETLPASSSNLLVLEQAATRDLEKGFIASGIANSLTVAAYIPKINQIALDIAIEANGQIFEFTFTDNWLATAA